jgi:hypothetical protein
MRDDCSFAWDTDDVEIVRELLVTGNLGTRLRRCRQAKCGRAQDHAGRAGNGSFQDLTA